MFFVYFKRTLAFKVSEKIKTDLYIFYKKLQNRYKYNQQSFI